jgi:hypothetical protein
VKRPRNVGLLRSQRGSGYYKSNNGHSEFFAAFVDEEHTLIGGSDNMNRGALC